MGTAGLGSPNLLGLDVVERPVRGMVPIPGQAACELQPWYMELSKGEFPEGDFDHAQSVNFRPDPTLRGGSSWCREPRNRGFRPGASRSSLPSLTNTARRLIEVGGDVPAF
jgi:hypothetical protein